MLLPDFKTETVFTMALLDSLLVFNLPDNEDAMIAETFGILTLDGKWMIAFDVDDDFVVGDVFTSLPTDFGMCI